MTPAAEVERRKRLLSWIAGVVIAMIAVRLTYIFEPSGSDEAGFLMVGGQWHNGTSLYGDYWVDRPPLLIWIMEAASSVTGLRVIGVLSSTLMVVGIARAAWLAAGYRAAYWASGAATLYCSAYWFGISRTNGEMLASPFVAWAMAWTIQATGRSGRAAWGFGALAGASAAGAVLVKQSIIDGVVFAVVFLLLLAWQDRERRFAHLRLLAAGVAGAVGTTALCLALAALRGTYPADLFDALVTFRAEAGRVISASASPATHERFKTVMATWAVSGLAPISLVAAWRSVRYREPTLVAATVVLAYGTAATILGGSYWSHYLIQLLPAIALAVGLLGAHMAEKPRHVFAGFLVLVTVANGVNTMTNPPVDSSQAQRVGSWLGEVKEPGDTAVVAYGQPHVLANAGMQSPYEHLWSLPIRTRDPDLAGMSAVLAGPQRPTWFIAWTRIDSWGITDPDRLLRVLRRNYVQLGQVCGRTIWVDRSQRRDITLPTKC